MYLASTFAIFHHYPTWSWNDLLATLTYITSSHLTLEHETTTQVQQELTPKISNETGMFQDVNEASVSLDTSSTLPTTTPLPIQTSDGRQVYRLQKKIEQTFGHCTTPAFSTSNIPTLEQPYLTAKESWKPYL